MKRIILLSVLLGLGLAAGAATTGTGTGTTPPTGCTDSTAACTNPANVSLQSQACANLTGGCCQTKTYTYNCPPNSTQLTISHNYWDADDSCLTAGTVGTCGDPLLTDPSPTPVN